MVPSSEETFQSLSQQIDLADSDVLQSPDRISETEDVSVNHPENTELVASQEDCETDIPEEESVLLFSRRDDDETLTANVKDEESRQDLLIPVDLVCLSAGDPNQGLCTYLNLAPNVETEEQKLKRFRQTNSQELGNRSTWTC